MTDKTVPLGDHSFYANVFSYMGLPLSRDLGDSRVDAVIMGVPYDLATSGRAGTRSGPHAIRQASGNMRWEEKRRREAYLAKGENEDGQQQNKSYKIQLFL